MLIKSEAIKKMVCKPSCSILGYSNRGKTVMVSKP